MADPQKSWVCRVMPFTNPGKCYPKSKLRGLADVEDARATAPPPPWWVHVALIVVLGAAVAAFIAIYTAA